MRARICIAVLIAIVGAAGMQGQPTRRVRVRLSGECTALTNLKLVLQGNEQKPVNIPTDEMKIFTWDGVQDQQIEAEGSCGSMRLGKHRTDCVLSKPIMVENTPTAYFEFDCDENPAPDVVITADPPQTPFHYVRELPNNECDCKAEADRKGTATASAVRLPVEQITLQFGSVSQRQLFSLPLNPILDSAKNSVPVTLPRSKVVEKILGPRRETPKRDAFVPDEYDVQETVFGDLKMLTLTKVP